MRVAATLFVVLGMTAALTACSAAPEAEAPEKSTSASECIAKSGANSDAVKVEGDFGATPTVEFDFPLEASKTERTVVIEGGGEAVASGDVISADIAMYNATTGAEVSNSGFTEGTAADFTVSKDAVLAGLVNTLQCTKEGSRVVAVIPPAEMWGEAGFADYEIKGTDSLVMVADVVAIVPPLEPAKWTENVPEVDFSADVPVVALPKDDVPAELQLAVLKEGDGPKVEATQMVTIDYQGTSWETGEVFDQSYGAEPITYPASNFVPGFSAALAGQKVGSTVLVTIPAEHAYGTDPAAHELGGQTLLFVIEIQDAQNAGE